MGKAEKERLNGVLVTHLNTIHETFQVLDQAPPSSMEKVSWEEVIKMGEQVSKQATTAGMLWSGQKPEVKEVEENMAAYVNVLQGFLLLSHGSTAGAGPTLSATIHASVKQVVDCSFKFLMESVSSYGSRNKDQKLTIPQLVGAVWESCSALKKIPATNITAIGRAMTQVAVSMKDVLRELKELKPEASEESPIDDDDDGDDDDNMDDLGNDLSAEEMRVARSAIQVVSETIGVTKELIRSITGLLKLEKPDDRGDFVNSLEKLLKLCREVGAQIDELGACLYPPQEISAIQAASGKISSMVGDMQGELEKVNGTSEAFFQACDGLKRSLKSLEAELCHCDGTELAEQIESVTLSD